MFSFSLFPVAKSPCSPTERRVSRSTQSCGSFTITPFTTSKENLPVLNTRIICPGKHACIQKHMGRHTVFQNILYIQLVFFHLSKHTSTGDPQNSLSPPLSLSVHLFTCRLAGRSCCLYCWQLHH